MTTIPPTDRTTVRRLPKRGHYDRETIYAILDEAVTSDSSSTARRW